MNRTQIGDTKEKSYLIFISNITAENVFAVAVSGPPPLKKPVLSKKDTVIKIIFSSNILHVFYQSVISEVMGHDLLQ